jgi:hypothetical protein
MNDFFDKLRKNKIQILKLIITAADIYFLFISIVDLLYQFKLSLFMSFVIFYLIIIVICTLLSEYSPYILHNHLVHIFPFLTSYSGRGCVYLMVGSIYSTPEIGKFSNYAGYAILIVGVLCIVIHIVVSGNQNNNENQDILAMKNNYDDFSQASMRESLNFPKNLRESNVRKSKLNEIK